jgi:ribose/xylose/arabinose/galactoside ABC-type transport system permease subunit
MSQPLYLLGIDISTTGAKALLIDADLSFVGSANLDPRSLQLNTEMGLLVSLAVYFLANTVLGRQIYAVGSNLEAARLSGVNVDRVRIFVYTLTGGLCGFAGIMSAGLLSTAATNAGEGSELDVIAAVVIGGASLSGGVGTVTGTVIGAAIMAVLKNAFVLLHMPSYAQTLSIGVVIILAVAFDRLRRARG